MGVEKVRDGNVFSAAMIAAAEFLLLTSAEKTAFTVGIVAWLRKRTSRLRFWGSRRQEELLPHELQSPQTQATQADLILEVHADLDAILYLLGISRHDVEAADAEDLALAADEPAP